VNAVTGTTFTAKFSIFSGSHAKFVKTVAITARITGVTTRPCLDQHWIYFEVTASDDADHYKVGNRYKKQGMNFYPYVSTYDYPATYEELAAYKNRLQAIYGYDRTL